MGRNRFSLSLFPSPEVEFIRRGGEGSRSRSAGKYRSWFQLRDCPIDSTKWRKGSDFTSWALCYFLSLSLSFFLARFPRAI